MSSDRSLHILVLNPNSSSSITAALQSALIPYVHPGIKLTFFNPSYGPTGIHDAATAQESCDACMDELFGTRSTTMSKSVNIAKFDGVLVSCFSEHPLIPTLRDRLAEGGAGAGAGAERKQKTQVIGMFHAGITSALFSKGPFGILATGTGDKPNLVLAVANFLGTTSSTRFAGVLTTGLGVVELQEGDQEKVRRNMMETTGRLVDQGARNIVLGCAGMSGMNDMVIEAARAKGKEVTVVDGARAGIELLAALIRSRAV